MPHPRFWLALLIIPLVLVAVLMARGVTPPEPVLAGDAAELPAPVPAAPAAPAYYPDDVPRDVVALLEQGRPWRAARRMREHLAAVPDASPGARLVAARAEARWGGWQRAGALLDGAPWLDAVANGEGWYWLARVREEAEDWRGAAAAYDRALRAAGDAQTDWTAPARLRHALVLLRAGQPEPGIAALADARSANPALGAWTDLLAADALAERGDTAGVRRLLAAHEAERAPRVRRTLLRAHAEAGDAAGTRRLAAAYRAAAESDAERGHFAAAAGRAALEAGDTAGALAELRWAVGPGAASPAAAEAARLLAGLPGLRAEDRLAMAEALGRHGDRARAITQYEAWLRTGAGDAQRQREVRLRLGRLQFAAARYDDVVAALRPLLDAPAPVAAEALFLTGRAEYRRGNQSRGRALFQQAAERHPQGNAAAEALFMVGDLAHDAGELQLAREAFTQLWSSHPTHERAGLGVMRLAGMAFLEGRYPAAAELWDAYRQVSPRGVYWMQATYWAGRAHEAGGDRAVAEARYRAAREREPVSYYALLSVERLGEPFWPAPLAPAPALDEAAAARVRQALQPVDLLRDAGLLAEADAEVDRLIALAGDDESQLYPLAEALVYNGFAVKGLRIGLRLQQAGPLNLRLLRILYPFPYREVIEAEARERGLNVYQVAALVRQESSFQARIASPAGARGLMQVMPETGRRVAAGLGIGPWDAELLYQPEINVYLGTRYLADQMRSYGRVLPYVYSAYNAGPARIDRWRRTLPEARDELLFTERIPFAETRGYVKILRRNEAIYRGLYGDAGAAR